jgi:hypothetical protein
MERSSTSTTLAAADERMRSWFLKHFRGCSGAGVTIAVIDSGWRSDWKDPAIQSGFSIAPSLGSPNPSVQPDAEDRLGHGSNCILLLKELAPKARILPVKVFDKTLQTSPYAVTAAVEAATREGVDLINLSLSTRSLSGMQDLYAACKHASNAGTIVIASGDNDMGGYPAAFDTVVGVAGLPLSARFAYGRSPSRSLDFSANRRTYVTLPTSTGRRRPVNADTCAERHSRHRSSRELLPYFEKATRQQRWTRPSLGWIATSRSC